jgi:hypothetical protein
MCGSEQKVVPLEERNLDQSGADSAGGGRRSELLGSAFRRPMQAFSGMRSKSGQSNPSARPAPQPFVPPPPVDFREPAVAAAPVVQEPVRDDRIKLPDATIAGTSGPWVVRSPTGLVLEFQSSAQLVSWSGVLDNPAPYQVSRGDADWQPLDQILREVKRGSRVTHAFIRTMDGSGGSEALPPARSGDTAGSDENRSDMPEKSSTGGSSNRAPAATAQFQFKIANSTKPPTPGWVVGLIVGLAVLALAGAAAFVILGNKW